MPAEEQPVIAVIGLGYVGLPLALALAREFLVVGYDTNAERVDELNRGEDHTLEAEPADVAGAFESGLRFTADIASIATANVYIVTVPTPIDKFKAPDLGPLLAASATIGKLLRPGDVVIYESTTYPGCTEEDCVPVLELHSGLKFNVDFFCGYSPERINPGDRVNRLETIRKVTSGSTPETAAFVDGIYRRIIKAGTYPAASIKVAEAAKAIENAQRDVNISFVNELALIFDRLGIDTRDVLEAAGTKWNFLKYSPGLVGGHCIGVDPYYLAHKAQSVGYHPEVILSGRRVNDSIGMFVANKVVKLMIAKGHAVYGSKALVLGITFKENCPDIRNTRVVDIVAELEQFGVQVDVVDPWAEPGEVRAEYGIQLAEALGSGYHAVVLAVAHEQFAALQRDDLRLAPQGVIYDTKALWPRNMVDGRL